MLPDRPNAEALFHQALELESHDRAAFLTAACAGDAALRQRVEALLAAHEKAGGFLPEGAAEGPGTVPEETPSTEIPGTLIGRYKLLEKLGEGGFGSVWAAEQREPVRRRVALKIIKLGMDTKQVIARFEAERQALALMDHPNIAKVLDAGATDTGRPYFVMELVRGIPITTYCNQERLSTDDRLDLFIKVCNAIQHAHQKGIIHRDIKPSNIMVTLHDGIPVPKVIDFGIAKATQAELTEKTIYTQLHQFIGTPAYMSPEQAEMSGLDIDTRSDIYSLGILLYELLTGKTPFDGKALLLAGLDEMRRIIREQEPMRPSTKLSQTRAAEARGLAKSKIRNPKSRIDRDLDCIVMKCLEKDRARRYETANGLAADLKRHRNNETIVARPPSTVYRLQKAFRRNKLVFTAATVAALALLVGLGVSAWQATVATRARNTAETARVTAEQATSLAVQREATITRILYFAEMNLAGHAAMVPDGISRVAEVTAKWRPETGAVDQRGWEWYYLRSLIHFDLFTINGHTSAVLSVAWSPDAQRLASASKDNTIKVWDAVGGTNILILRGHSDQVQSLSWSPDGQRLASGSKDHTIKTWDANSGQETLTLRGHTDAVCSVAWRPDGKRLASGSFDNTAKIWDMVSQRETRTLTGYRLWINSVAWSPDGRHLATASADNTLRIYDPDSELAPHILRGHPHPFAVNSVAWSPDGKRLASGGNDHDVIVWETDNTGSWTNVSTLRGHTQHVLSVEWSSDGKRLVSAGGDHTLMIWDVASKTKILTLRGHTRTVNSVHWSPDGKRLASGSSDNMVKVWDVAGEETMTVRGHPQGAFSVAWSPDGKRLASGGADNTVKLWDTATRTNILTLHAHTDCVFSLVWSPDGKRLASGSFDKTVKIWSADGDTNVITVRDHPAGLFSVAWSPDGKSLASSTWYENNFNIWDADSRQVTHTLSGHSAVFSLAWSPDGKRLASANWDHSVKIWDPASGELIYTLTGHTDVARSVAWSPDGKRLVSGGRDHTIKVWDAESGTNILTLRGHTSEVVLAVWSPDGKRLASGSFDGTVRVWDPDGGHETLALRGHTAQVQSIAWSPDGMRIASASRDHTVKIWDAGKAYALEREQSANRVQPPDKSIRRIMSRSGGLTTPL